MTITLEYDCNEIQQMIRICEARTVVIDVMGVTGIGVRSG